MMRCIVFIRQQRAPLNLKSFSVLFSSTVKLFIRCFVWLALLCYAGNGGGGGVGVAALKLCQSSKSDICQCEKSDWTIASLACSKVLFWKFQISPDNVFRRDSKYAKEFANVQLIRFQRVELERIEPGAFTWSRTHKTASPPSPPSPLEKLLFVNNKLREIEPFTFANLTLHTLAITENNEEGSPLSLQPDAMAYLTARVIKLDSNKLRVLPFAAFRHTKFAELHVNKNHLATLSSQFRVFASVPTTTTTSITRTSFTTSSSLGSLFANPRINLAENDRLRCNCSLLWLAAIHKRFLINVEATKCLKITDRAGDGAVLKPIADVLRNSEGALHKSLGCPQLHIESVSTDIQPEFGVVQLACTAADLSKNAARHRGSNRLRWVMLDEQEGRGGQMILPVASSNANAAALRAVLNYTRPGWSPNSSSGSLATVARAPTQKFACIADNTQYEGEAALSSRLEVQLDNLDRLFSTAAASATAPPNHKNSTHHLNNSKLSANAVAATTTAGSGFLHGRRFSAMQILIAVIFTFLGTLLLIFLVLGTVNCLRHRRARLRLQYTASSSNGAVSHANGNGNTHENHRAQISKAPASASVCSDLIGCCDVFFCGTSPQQQQKLLIERHRLKHQNRCRLEDHHQVASQQHPGSGSTTSSPRDMRTKPYTFSSAAATPPPLAAAAVTAGVGGAGEIAAPSIRPADSLSSLHQIYSQPPPLLGGPNGIAISSTIPHNFAANQHLLHALQAAATFRPGSVMGGGLPAGVSGAPNSAGGVAGGGGGAIKLSKYESSPALAALVGGGGSNTINSKRTLDSSTYSQLAESVRGTPVTTLRRHAGGSHHLQQAQQELLPPLPASSSNFPHNTMTPPPPPPSHFSPLASASSSSAAVVAANAAANHNHVLQHQQCAPSHHPQHQVNSQLAESIAAGFDAAYSTLPHAPPSNAAAVLSPALPLTQQLQLQQLQQQQQQQQMLFTPPLQQHSQQQSQPINGTPDLNYLTLRTQHEFYDFQKPNQKIYTFN